MTIPSFGQTQPEHDSEVSDDHGLAQGELAGSFESEPNEFDDDTDEDADEAEDSNAQVSSSSTPTLRNSRRRRAPDKNLIRRAANKVVELIEADEAEVELLAKTLGAKSDSVELAVAILSAPRGSLSSVSEVLDLADKPETERAVALMVMGRAKMKVLWELLADVGSVPAAMPTSESKAALELAGVDLDADARGRLQRVIDLSKRS